MTDEGLYPKQLIKVQRGAPKAIRGGQSGYRKNSLRIIIGYIALCLSTVIYRVQES
jgi:hypothetical protein